MGHFSALNRPLISGFGTVFEADFAADQVSGGVGILTRSTA